MLTKPPRVCDFFAAELKKEVHLGSCFMKYHARLCLPSWINNDQHYKSLLARIVRILFHMQPLSSQRLALAMRSG